MNRKDLPQSVIDSYRRRQQMAPLYIAGLAVVLVIIGIVVLVIWFRGNTNSPVVSFAASTPTATITETATNTVVPPTATATVMPTDTEVPTATLTPTTAGPFEYKVEAGDNCWTIAVDKFKINPDVLLALNGFTPGTCPISPGMTIMIPLPDTKLPTDTPVPSGASGKVEYYVKTGELLNEIADTFHTTVEQIMKDNPDIKDQMAIKAGDKLIITTNTVTATPTKTATTEVTATLPATATTEATQTPTPKP